MLTLKIFTLLNILSLISGLSFYNSTLVGLYDYDITINHPTVNIDMGLENNPSLVYQIDQTLYIMTRKSTDPSNKVDYQRYVIYKKDLNVPYTSQLVVDQLDLYGGTAWGFKIENSTDTLENIVMTGPDGSLAVCGTQRSVLGQPLFYVTTCKEVPLRSASTGNVYTAVDYLSSRIYIAGIYENPDYGTSNSYLVYFDIALNFTVWIKYTEGNFNMDIEKLIYYPDQEVVLLFAEYDKNTYFRTQVYAKGEYYDDGFQNNILIINYDSYEGKIKWTRLIGHGQYDDQFVGAKIYDGELITLHNSLTGYYSGFPGFFQDTVLNRISMDIGEVLSTIYIGGFDDTTGLGLIANVQGIFVLINYYYCVFPHPTVSTCFSPNNGATPNELFSGVFFFSWNDEAVDIESFQIANEYNLITMYGFVDPSTYLNKFVYVSSDFNTSTGLYFTGSVAGVSFDRSSGTTTDCDKVSRLFATVCLKCVTGRFLYKNQCYASCPTSSTQISLGSSSYCIACHHSCSTCNNEKKFSRLSCDTCNTLSGFSTPTNLGCTCSSGFNEYDKVCTAASNFVTKCPAKYNVYDYDFLCKYECPPDTFQYFDYTGQTIAALSSKTSGYNASTDCVRDMNYLHFIQGSTGLEVPANGNHSTLASTEFTMSFWIMLDNVIDPATSDPYTTFIAAFDQISISQKNTGPSYLTMTMFMSSPTELADVPNPGPYCGTGSSCLPEKIWVYVAVAKKVTSNIISAYLIGLRADQSTNPTPHYEVTSGGANVQSTFRPFQPSIFIGDFYGSTGSSTSSFNGIIKEFKIFSKYMNNDYMFHNRYRRNFDFSADQPYLVAYWQLNEEYVNSGDIRVVDHSIIQLSTTVTQGAGVDPRYLNAFTDNFGGNVGLANVRTQLTLCKMQDLFTCIGFGDYHRSLVVPHGRWLDNLIGWAGPRYFDVETRYNTYGSQTLISLLDADELSVRRYTCNNPTIIVKKTYSSGASKFLYDSGAKQFYDLTPGHYEMCFRHSGGETIHIGGVYVQQLPRSVTPSNWANYKPLTSGNSPLIVETDLGDYGNGDIITLDGNCTIGALSTNISSLRSDRSNGRWTPLPVSVPGVYSFCFVPQYDTSMQEPIPWAEWTVQGTPQISKALWNAEITTNFSLLVSTLDIGRYLVGGSYFHGDKLWITPATNCTRTFYVGSVTYRYGSWERIFFGWRSGTVALSTLGTRSASQFYSLSMCYEPASSPYSTGVDLSPTLVLNNDNTLFVMFVQTPIDVVATASLSPNYPFPSLTTFFPAHTNYAMRSTESPFVRFDVFVFPDLGSITIDILHYDELIRMYNYTTGSTTTSTITLANGGINVPSSGPVTCSANGICEVMSQNWLKGNVYQINFASNNFKRLHPGNSNLYYFLVFNPGSPRFDFRISILDFDIDSSQASAIIFPGATDVWFSGTNIGSYIANTLISGVSSTQYWRTTSIRVDFYIVNSSNSSCNYNFILGPSGSTKPTAEVCEWTDDAFRVMDLNLFSCSDGVLMGNISMVRRMYDQTSQLPLTWTGYRNIFRDSFVLGKIGCESSCETCNGPDSQSCIFCSNSDYVNYNGSCMSDCPWGFYKYNTTLYNTKTFNFEWLIMCQFSCPDKYYPDSNNFCQTCPTHCLTCTSDNIGNCTSCDIGFILFEGICVTSCPAGYTADFSGIECLQDIPSSSGLSVRIIEADFSQRVAWGTLVTLRASITDNFNTVNKIEWHHIDDPSVSSPYGNTIFSSDTKNSPFVQIDTSIFPMTYSLPIHIMILVSNNETTVADLYEFYINLAPVAGTFRLSPTAGSAITTSFTAYFENWDDTAYERARYSLSYRIECEMTDGSTILVLPSRTIPYSANNEYNISGIYFPLISTTADVTINVYLIASDTFGAENYTVYQLPLKRPTVLSNSITEADKLNSYITLLKNVSNIVDMTSLLTLTSTTQMIYNSFDIDSQAENNCLNDFQCFSHGTCITSLTYSFCACEVGYSGRNCQFPSSLISLLNQTNTNALNWLSNSVALMTTTEYIQNMQTISQALKYICTQGKITNVSITAAMSVLEAFTDLSVDEAIKIPQDVRETFLKSVSSVFEMYFYYVNTENAVIDEMLYPGLSHTQIDAIKTSRNLTRQNVMKQLMTLNDKITDILAGTAIPTYNPIIVDTKIFRATLITHVVSYFQNNNITSSPKEEGFYIQVPASTFRVGVNIPSPYVEVRMKMMQYYENPYQFYPGLKLPETDVIEVDFLDAYSNKFSIKNNPDPFDIYIPWSEYHQEDLAEEMIDCVWWDPTYTVMTNITQFVTVNSSIYNSSYLASHFNFVPTSLQPWKLLSVPNTTYFYNSQPNYNGSGCTFIESMSTHTVCRCNHLTSFAGIYNQPHPIPWNKRISDFYITPVSIPWYDTLGFYFLISLTSLFFVLTIGCWMSEIGILQKKLKRLFLAKAKIEKVLYNKIMTPEDLLADSFKPQPETEVQEEPDEKVSRGKLQNKIKLGKEIEATRPRKVSEYDRSEKDEKKSKARSKKDDDQESQASEKKSKKSKRKTEDDVVSEISKNFKKDDEDDDASAAPSQAESDFSQAIEAAKKAASTEKSPSLYDKMKAEEEKMKSEGNKDHESSKSLRVIPKEKSLGESKEGAGYLFSIMRKKDQDERLPPIKENLERPSKAQPKSMGDAVINVENNSKHTGETLQTEARSERTANKSRGDLEVEDLEAKMKESASPPSRGKRAIQRRGNKLQSNAPETVSTVSRATKGRGGNNLPVVQEGENEDDNHSTHQDQLNSSQEILLKDENKNRGKISLNKLNKREIINPFDKLEDIPLNDPDLVMIEELEKYKYIDEVNDFKIYKKLKKIAARKAQEDIYKLNFFQLYVRSTPLLNVWTITSFLVPRYTRVTLIFINIYLQCLLCALFHTAIYGKPLLQTTAVVNGNLEGSDVGIVILSNILTGLIMYTFFALFKVSDVRIRIARTIRELDNTIFELKREQKMKFFLAYFLTLCTIGVTFWYCVTFSSTFGWESSFQWLWTVFLAIFWDAFLYDPLVVLAQYILQGMFNFGKTLARIRSIKITIPDY